jgi:NSS family neurotransmitter:Na+ symporter
MFTNFVSGKYEPLLFLFLYLFLNGWVVTSGIKNGIEKFSKIIMPLLIIMVMFIAIWSMTLPGAGAGLKFLFYPDFSKVTPHTFLAAIGQSFFSLSLGCGTMLTYASYIKEKSYVVPTCIYTATADTLFAILAGMAIMPAVFAYGISPSQGPGLVFVTLPYIFSHMPLGTLFATLFFFSIFLAAITSSISILEVPVTFILEEFKIKRKTAVKICLSVITVTGILCSLSEGLLKNIHIFGKDLFDLFDFSSSNIFMTTTALLTVIFVGWKMKKGTVTNALSNNGKRKINPIYVTGVYYTIKYIAPVIVAVIMIRGLF